MRNRQRGVTLIGWIFLLTPLAIIAYAGIRLFPVVLNYVKVSRILDQIAVEMRSEESLSAALIRTAIEKRFDIDYVEYPQPKDIAIRREGSGWVMQASYEDVAPLFANASILLRFDKSVAIE